jgi:hypothetical protein
MSEQRTEISFECTAAETAVLDAYCVAHGIKRTQVMRQLLKDWSDKTWHQATLIVRVAGNKPDSAGAGRE